MNVHSSSDEHFSKDWQDETSRLPLQTKQIGLLAFLGTVTMLFAGFTSAYIVRRSAADWSPVDLPSILWLNTGLLLLSSVFAEMARRAQRRWALPALKRWLTLTLILGILFLGGQFIAWRQLMDRGVFMPTSPHSSFFYLLTGVHGIHLLGGLIALLVVLVRTHRGVYTPYHAGVSLAIIYWHFVDILWVYVYVVLRYF